LAQKKVIKSLANQKLRKCT